MAERGVRAVGLLSEGLDRLGYLPAPGQVDQLGRYIAEIELWNPRLKLVAAAGRELVVRHVLDSLAGIGPVIDALGTGDAGAGSAPLSVADLGSGAGFPGIPIAIMHPECRVDLVERSGRRAGFLRNAVAATRLANAAVRETGLEAYEEPVTLAVYRALHPLSATLYAALLRISGPGGLVCAYKGKRESVEAEVQAVRRGSGASVEAGIVPVEVPFLSEARHFLLFGGGLGKVSSTLQVRPV